MKIAVLGGDGYLGWPTALHLSRQGHDVAVVDNFARRQYDFEMGVDSLVPIKSLQHRVRTWEEVSGLQIEAFVGDLDLGAHAVHGEWRRSGMGPTFVPALAGVAGPSVLWLFRFLG